MTYINNPNAKLGRTIWSAPQRGLSCKLCAFFVKGSDGLAGKCMHLRIWAAYGRDQAPWTYSYYYCNFYEEKEKENE